MCPPITVGVTDKLPFAKSSTPRFHFHAPAQGPDCSTSGPIVLARPNTRPGFRLPRKSEDGPQSSSPARRHRHRPPRPSISFSASHSPSSIPQRPLRDVEPAKLQIAVVYFLFPAVFRSAGCSALLSWRGVRRPCLSGAWAVCRPSVGSASWPARACEERSVENKAVRSSLAYLTFFILNFTL